MCTAVTYQTQDLYFGRTLDYDFSYDAQFVIAPRNFPFRFHSIKTMRRHYAMMGIAYVLEDYPLYYESVNEKGLCIAGLHFVGNAVYRAKGEKPYSVAQFELIPWILGQCSSLDEAKELILKTDITNAAFSQNLPPAQIHWLISDRSGSITLEPTKDGLKMYENPVGVLTNNPPFCEQMFYLNHYIGLSAKQPENRFSKKLNLQLYSSGMGALGLPGDFSSPSRFVRASFVKLNSVSQNSEEESVNQFFHILNSVDQPRGCCETSDGKYVTTIYTSCYNADLGVFYYTTYENHQISSVSMQKENLEKDRLILFPLQKEEQIKMQN